MFVVWVVVVVVRGVEVVVVRGVEVVVVRGVVVVVVRGVVVVVVHGCAWLCMVVVFGVESATRPDSKRAGASGLLLPLLVRFGNDVETLDDGALGDECSDGKEQT